MTSFLGIDAGNTGIKAVLFDPEGVELARAHRDTGGTCPAPGMVERDVARLRRDLDALIAELLAKSGRSGDDVAAVGTAGHGNGLYLLDEGGEPLAAVQSLDTRAAGIVSEWEASGVANQAAAIALQRPWSSQTPTLLAWFTRHRPEVMARARHLLMCKDLVTHALTGAYVSDVSDMGGAGLLNLRSSAYDPSLLAAYGLDGCEGLLPRLLWPTQIAGTITAEAAARTGLKAGTPVVAGLFDVVAGAIGAGVTKVGQASMIVGTWSINQAIVAQPVPDAFMSCGVSPGRFMAMENSATSAANLEWVAHNLLGGHDAFARADALAAETPQRADAPLYHPYLYGTGSNPYARASLFGLAGWHGAGDMMRALFEGVAFAHLAHLDRLRSHGIDIDAITLSGGGSRSPVWPRMLADMLGEPVHVSMQPEAGALGAAMAAAVGTGHFPDLDAAASAMVPPPRVVEPDPARESLYRRRYAIWQELGEGLAPHWKSLQALAGA